MSDQGNMDQTQKIDDTLVERLNSIANRGFQNAAIGFSQMIGQTLSVSNAEVQAIPINQIAQMLGGPENDAVGIYLRIEGELSGQVMMIIPHEQALELVDMVMDEPPGSTQRLGKVERSALAEIGNLTGSFFINAVADFTRSPARPTPPAVMVDMVGAILDVIIATMGEVCNDVLMFKAKFTCGEREVRADFWVIPDALTLNRLSEVGDSDG